MTTVRLTGHIDENGHIEISQRVDLLPGEVTVTIEGVTAEEQAAIDERWDQLLASPKSLAFLEKLGNEALAELDAGLTDELDPDTL